MAASSVVAGLIAQILAIYPQYHAPATLPSIREVSQAKIAQLCHNNSHDVVACYRRVSGRGWIFFHGLDIRSIVGQAYLGHELVHAVQDANDAFTHFACPRESEREAYAFTNIVLAENPRIPQVSAADIDRASHCD